MVANLNVINVPVIKIFIQQFEAPRKLIIFSLIVSFITFLSRRDKLDPILVE